MNWFDESPNFLNDRTTNGGDHLIEPFHRPEEDSRIQRSEETNGVDVLVS